MRVTVYYKGWSDKPLQIRRPNGTYEVWAGQRIIEVDPEDWKGWPDRRFFEVIEPPDPAQIDTDELPLDHPVTIDPADGISDVEAVAAEQALARYRQERAGEKLDRLLGLDSQDWQDYYEAVQDED